MALSENRLANKLAEGRVTAQAELSRKIAQHLSEISVGRYDNILSAASAKFNDIVSRAIADLVVLEEPGRVRKAYERTSIVTAK